MTLPIRPPYEPLELRAAERIPDGPQWQYEPKWDGFRCLAFRDGDDIYLQSKAGEPLARYFPEVVERLREIGCAHFVLDGELVIPDGDEFSFDALLQRIHPAASRVAKLAEETPARYIVFDLLVDGLDNDLTGEPLALPARSARAFHCDVRSQRRRAAFGGDDRSRAGRSLVCAGRQCSRRRRREASRSRVRVRLARGRRKDQTSTYGGLRRRRLPLEQGAQRRRIATARPVRRRRKTQSRRVYVELPRSATQGRAREDSSLRGAAGLYRLRAGRSEPGGPSRWRRTDEPWFPLAPKLVVEVRYDHVTGGRFRHGTTFLRWRPDKKPRLCTMDQLSR